MNTPTDVERRLRLSVNAPRMLDALKTALPMIELMCTRLGVLAAANTAKPEVRHEYDAWLVILLEVSGAVTAAEPESIVQSNVVMMTARMQ